jgi:hypothetical protein
MKAILLILVSFYSYATVTLESCTEKASRYYSTEEIPSIIPNECARLIESIEGSNLHTQNESGTVKISAFKNIVYINDNGVHRFIAGNLSRLNDILAVTFDESESRIFVLNKNQERQKEVLSYRYNISGNVSPVRSLETHEIQMATGIKVENNFIHVISSSHEWKKTFHKNADPNGKRKENSSNLLREISGKFD